MNLLHITDLGAWRVQVSWQRGNAVPRPYKRAILFDDALSTKDRKELRWCLEEYLKFPFGAERDRAERVEQQMAWWGKVLFEHVFTKKKDDPDPRGF